jgi:hypothetical protein
VTDAERGDVLQISHANNANLAGLFFGSTTGVDVSGFINGAIEFDIKVVSGDANITMKLDCTYPCTSGDKLLGEKGVGWLGVSQCRNGRLKFEWTGFIKGEYRTRYLGDEIPGYRVSNR